MKRMIAAAVLTAFAGCLTVYETQYPEVLFSRPAREGVSVQVAGFEASVTTYMPVYGYETFYTYRHRRMGGYWGPSTVSTQTYIPRTSDTAVYRDRATEILETSGFSVMSTNPAYRVEVKFTGPVVTDEDRGIEAAWSILSVFSADYGVQQWSAKLKIYDMADGRLLMHHDYSERYQAVVWGPLPLFSPAGSEKTAFNTIQNWCLSALTERTMSDATAFLSSLPGKDSGR